MSNNGNSALADFARNASGAAIEVNDTPLIEQIDGKKIVARPNGEAYITRMIGGMTDVEFLRKAVENKLGVCLYGPPGTGKTAMCEAAFGDQLITTECDEGTSTEALVGGYVPTPGGSFEWRYGDLAEAMSQGKVWFGDDVTAADPRVLSRTYPAFDGPGKNGRGQLTVKEHLGEKSEGEESFGAVIAYNPDLLGQELPSPLRSRFLLHVFVGTDHTTMRQAGVDPNLIRSAAHLEHLSGTGDGTAISGDTEVASWAPQAREMLAFKRISETFSVEVAVQNLLGVCPSESRAALSAKLEEFFGNGLPMGLLKTTARFV